MLSNYLELLTEVSQAMTTSVDLNESLRKILHSFSHFLGLNRGTLTLLESDTDVARIVASVGLTRAEQARGIFKIGEGITGHVLKTGESLAIPLVESDQRFLNKTGSRPKLGELSFLCVPIVRQGKIIGALSADRDYQKGRSLKNDLQILKISTAIITQLMQMHDMWELNRMALVQENEELRSELQHKFQFKEIIGHSDKMQEVFRLLEKVVASNATVMIRGESGTGKELVAHAIHYNSGRSDKPFIKVNCSAIPESLLESELFGHEKGAFTGALQGKPGRFEMAQGGTLFLDEVGDFPMTTQVKLLRVLQAREVERLGGTRTLKLDVRLIVATNRNLEADMKVSRFREDLYYRINVFPVFLPPLRERKTDILLLAEHFLEKYTRENGKKITRITTPAIDMLMSYHWPGNVRELENGIERAVLVCDGTAIQGNHLPPSLQMADSDSPVRRRGLTQAVDNLEQEMIIEVLKEFKGNQRRAAGELGITERMLGYKIKKYGVNPRFYTAK